ncbi:MAG: tail fiber domain-containing protein [Bacteroidota bacterium]
MKNKLISCFAILAIGSTSLLSQVKYDSDGDFGIGTSSPAYLLHIKEADPIILFESTLNHDNTIRFAEGTNSFLGGFIQYDGGVNSFYLGVHSSTGTNLSHDKYSLKIDRNSGDVFLNSSLKVRYSDKSERIVSQSSNDYYNTCVTEVTNDKTKCYGVQKYGVDKFHVRGNGDVYVRGVRELSDISLKENIIQLRNSMDILTQLRPVKYNFKPDPEDEIMQDTRLEYGLIAQEVEQIIPNIVSTREDGLKTIAYRELIPLLIDAIQKQQLELDELKAQNSAIQKSATAITSLKTPDESLQSLLFQNIPNPFNENTTIRYSIPEIESHAMINVYDLQGRQVKSYSIEQTGEGDIMIPGSELNPGMFIYNLIVDGKEIASRRMILTE